jgi:hypothetical protein
MRAQQERKVGRFEDGMVLQPFLGVTDELIGALIEVHRHLGSGLLGVGLLANFNATNFRNALRRLTPNHPKSFRSCGLPMQNK